MREPSNLSRVGTSRTTLGEGIRYYAEIDTLLWHDIPESRALRKRGTRSEEDISLGPEAAFSCLTDDGRILSGGASGFCIDGLPTGPSFLSGAEVLNDGAAHPSGRFVVFGGRHRAEEEPLGHMWCLGRDMIRLPWRFTVFNGPAFSPDGGTVYFADSPERTIYSARVDADHQTLSERSVFAIVPASLGYPDGMVCDNDGGLWSAHWDGGCVTRYLADASVDFRIKLPCSRPTSLAFKGSKLFVTSAAVDDPETSDAPDGALFSLETEFSGSSSPRLSASVLDRIH